MNAFLAGLVTGVPLMITVGPIALMLVHAGVLRGFVAAWPAAIGVAAADLTWAVACAFGGSQLQRVLGPVSSALPSVAFVVLIAMAGVMLDRSLGAIRVAAATEGNVGVSTTALQPLALGRDGDPSVHHRSGLRLVASMFMLTVMNPLTIVAFTSVAVAMGRSATAPGWPVGIAVASLVVHGTLVAVGARIRHSLSPRGTSWLQLAGAVALAAMATNLVIAA